MEKQKIGFNQRMKNFFGKIKGRFKAFFNKEYLGYSFHKYKAFTALQMKEVFSKEKSANPIRDRVISIVSPIIKFAAIFAITFVLLFLNTIFGIVQNISIYYLLVFFTTIIVVLQFISAIYSCTKSYYIAEDNKVLITFPSSGASLFLSKLTVEFVKELKSTFEFYLPVAFGIIGFCAFSNPLSPMPIISLIWGLFPITLLCAIIVLAGSLFSVIYLQYLRLVKTIPEIRIVVLAILFGLFIYGAVVVINLIPPDIDLINMWNNMRAQIDAFLKSFTAHNFPINYFCSTLVGFTGNSYRGYKLNVASFGRFGLLFLIFLVLFLLVFIIIKKMFLHMMTKSVDYEKVKEHAHHRNIVHHQHTTFTFKELKISFRTLEISGTFVVTYVLIPVLVLLLCRIFDAINTTMKGNMLSILFIVLLTVLPLLASNTPISSAYSREGHAGYMKKTKPIKPYTPMFSKLLFNLVLSIPCIFASMFIVGKFGKIDIGSIIVLGVAVLLLQYGHIFYASTLDFTKPKNESYETEGQNAKNSNEGAATVVAFVLSFVFAFLVFFFFNEQIKLKQPFLNGAIRVLVFSLMVFGSNILLYFLKLKAFFMER